MNAIKLHNQSVHWTYNSLEIHDYHSVQNHHTHLVHVYTGLWMNGYKSVENSRHLGTSLHEIYNHVLTPNFFNNFMHLSPL